MNTKKAVFIDRDGTINEEAGYINHESRFVLIPGTIKALKILREAGFEIIIISSQPGIAHGYMTYNLVEKIHEGFKRKCKFQNIKITDIYLCPHSKNGTVKPYKIDCNCKKPKTGLIEKAVLEHDIDPSKSYFIGDNYEDMEMGWYSQLTPILVLTGYGMGEFEYRRKNWTIIPTFIANDLLDAAQWILYQNSSLLKKDYSLIDKYSSKSLSASSSFITI